MYCARWRHIAVDPKGFLRSKPTRGRQRSSTSSKIPLKREERARTRKLLEVPYPDRHTDWAGSTPSSHPPHPISLVTLRMVTISTPSRGQGPATVIIFWCRL